MRLTYLGHSGFCLETRNADFLMDCIGGYRRGSRPVAALVSHDHADHWQPAAVACADVLVRGMVPGEMREIYGARIRAYGSTDEGVSFLISVEGKQIFHAGDLNFWHWREESTFKEIAQAEEAFHAEVAPLIGREIDFAMFPLDPRMGEMYDAGAQYFLMEVRPKVMIPMHWWGRAEAALEFARRNRSKHTEILALTRPGESLRAERDPSGEIDIAL